MKFSCNRKDVLANVKQLAKIAKSNAILKELSGILLQADATNYELSMTATDSMMSLKCINSVAVVSSGSAVVNASLFFELLSQLPNDIVKFDLHTNNVLHIQSGNTKIEIPTLQANGYPKLELKEPQVTAKIKGIVTIARQTVFAVSNKNDNISLECVNIVISNDAIKAMGCDGTRMILNSNRIKNETDISFLIPAYSFQKFASMVEDADEISVGLESKNVVFSKQGFIYSARIVESIYIDVDAILKSTDVEFMAVVDAKKLTEGIQTVTAIGDSRHVNMAFQLGSIALSCIDENGKSSMLINAQVENPTSPNGFYYMSTKLLQSLKIMEGNIKIGLSKYGVLLIQTDTQRYMQVSTKPLLKKIVKKTAKKTKKVKVA